MFSTRITILISTIALAIGLAAPAFIANSNADEAGTAAKKAEKKKRRVTGSMTEKTYKKLTRIHGLIGEEKYDQALKLLGPLVTQCRSDYERAVVFQTYGFVYAAQEKYAKATEYLEKTLVLDVLREEQTRSLTFNLAQLYVIQGEYKKGIRTLENWFKTAESPDGHAYAMLATAYSQDKQYGKAIPALEKAISLTEDPKEAWYRLLVSLYYQQKKYSKTAEVLEIVTARWPENERYWKQLSTIYLTLKQDKRALAILEIAYRRGYLSKEREILQLANLHAYQNDPYEAAQVLESGIDKGLVEPTRKHLELLGNYCMSAQENDKAIEALSKAGEAADNGKIDLRVAYLLIEKENWSQAERALHRAVKKGGLRKPGKAWILLGMTAYELGRYSDANKYLNKAAGFEDSRDDAKQWLSHIESEQAILLHE